MNAIQTDGFLIVLQPELMLERYAAGALWENPEDLQAFREAFGMFDVSRYRGISRFPLASYPSLDPQIIQQFEQSGCDMWTNAAARRRFWEFMEETPFNSEDDDDLLPTYHAAKQVVSLTDEPSSWEVIHVSRGDCAGVGRLLGFDVGYWGGDHYSLIADTIVTPTWHGPAEEDFAELAIAMSDLNENILFPSAESAATFRAYYKTKPWAEKECAHGDEFHVIRVCDGNNAHG